MYTDHCSVLLVSAQVLALFSVFPGMLEDSTFTCYTWTGAGICTGSCIVLCVARNAAGQLYVHLLLHLDRRRYLRRCLNCYLCSQECRSTIRSPLTPGQALVFAQTLALFCVARNAGGQYVHLLHLDRLWYLHRCLHWRVQSPRRKTRAQSSLKALKVV